MSKKSKWQDDYWLLLMEIYLQKPVGVKPMYSKKMVDLSLELHIAPNVLFNKMCQIANLETPRIERIWETYGSNPKKLSRAVSLYRSMKGFNNAEDFYEGVEVNESFEKDFRPVGDGIELTPIMLTLILDLYFIQSLVLAMPASVASLWQCRYRGPRFVCRTAERVLQIVYGLQFTMNDKYGQIQEQALQQKQGQIFSHQQLLQASLVELPVAQLVDRINTEMNDNPALEIAGPGDEDYTADSQEYMDGADTASPSDEDFETRNEREERQSALDDALSAMGRDDEDLPAYPSGGSYTEEREEMVYGENTSFYDQLKEQMGETDMTERQRYIMEYLIGSLDDDGLLRKELYAISDELAIYHNIDATEHEIAEVLAMLHEFDPAGIGARNLQECLLLQIERRDPSRLRDLMKRVVNNYFDAFTKKHWQKIQAALSLNDEQAAALFRELRKLNPRPGASLGETMGRSMQQITPDFIVDTQDDGTVTFTLNNGEVPELKVSQSFADSMKEYQQNKENLSRQTKEALLYIKKKVDAAQGFIEAVKVRRHTLTITMRAIIQLQHQFFVDGDESSLRPMILKDVAEKTGLDLSTVSRVSNSKYALTRWGTFPLRYFFSDAITTENGEELSTRQIKAALRDMVDGEDKQHPMSDDIIKEKLSEMGYPIARRTVAKYREQLGIPIARLRK